MAYLCIQLEESLLLGVVRALRLLSSTEPVIAAQV